MRIGGTARFGLWALAALATAFAAGAVGQSVLVNRPAMIVAEAVTVPEIAIAEPTAQPGVTIGRELLIPASLANVHPAVEIDPVVTASIGAVDAAVAPSASAEFGAAMALVKAGDGAAAFVAASALADPTERLAGQWSAIVWGDGAVDHASVLTFATQHPEFANGSTFRTRLEQALLRSDPAPGEIIKVLGGRMPATLSGQIALALAYVAEGQRPRAESIVRILWTTDFLDRDSEDKVFKALGVLLTPADHWTRAVFLMMHDRASGVERLLPFLDKAQASLALARNAVSRNAGDAEALLDTVDPSMTDHPVYLFSRAQQAREAGLWDDAIRYLDAAGEALPEAAEWWYERRALTRELIGLKDYARAYKAAAGYTTGPEGRLVEAHFHAGWIALTFLGDAENAATHFEAMVALSTLPDSVTQANYWLGRARIEAGDRLGANEAFAAAARYSTVYYGQLARAELGMTGVHLRPAPDTSVRTAAFEAREAVKAIRLLVAAGETGRAIPMLRGLSERLEDGAELLLAARLAEEIGAHPLAVSIADIADKRGFPLDEMGFPADTLPHDQLAAVDVAAVYAVTRQESSFQLDAVSSSGALGLMQLMPATAKETAGKVGVDYSLSKLTSDAGYNTLLGSTYLAAKLAEFDGSLVLAAAAYNAGAGNVRKWLTAFGDPRDADVDPVTWVETIPLLETRKYVQRVIGNYLVYRARMELPEQAISTVMRRIDG